MRRSVRRADDGAWLQTRNTISLERRQTILAGPRAGAVSVCCAPDRWLLYALGRTLFNGHSRICKGFCFHYRRAVFRFCYVLSAADTGNAAAVSVPLYIPGTLCAARLDGSIQVFDTSTFTVDGQTVDHAFAVDTDGDFVADSEEAVFDGAFHESYFQSAPYFTLRIDGIEWINEAY